LAGEELPLAPAAAALNEVIVFWPPVLKKKYVINTVEIVIV
jgi:hypothetical protein